MIVPACAKARVAAFIAADKSPPSACSTCNDVHLRQKLEVLVSSGWKNRLRKCLYVDADLRAGQEVDEDRLL